MTEALAEKISRYLVTINAAKEEDREIVSYGLFHLLSSALQITILAVSALIFKSLAEIAAYTICFTTLKPYIGGAHAKKHWTCLWGFTLIANTGCFISRLIPHYTHTYVAFAFAMLMLILVLAKAPVPHLNMPVSAKKKSKMRRSSIISASIQFSAVLVCGLLMPEQTGLYIICGSLGGLSAAITLLMPMLGESKEVTP